MLVFKPGFFADVRIEDTDSTHLQYINGNIENFVSRKRKGAFLRVYDGEKWYYAATTDLENLQKELDKLYELGIPNPQIKDNPIVKKMPSCQGKLLKFENENVSQVTADAKIARITSVFPLFKKHDKIVMWQAYYLDKHVTKHIINSQGADVTKDWQQAGLAYFMNMKEEEKTFQERLEASADSFDKLQVSEADVKAFLQKSEDFLMNSKPLPPGKYQTILSPLVAGVFAHESFGHKSEADFMLGDENMKKEWQLGKKVGVDMLSIFDDGNIPGTGYVGYDDEGTPAEKTYLIKNGLLTGRLHSTETAVSLEEETTGNARAISFEFEPIVRMTGTIIEPGNIKKEELFAKVKKGIYIDKIKHGSGMSTFTLAPSFAYYIEDGKIAYPVEVSVVTGSVFDTLGKIEALSDQTEIFSFSVGGCGKMEQYPLPVSFGGPYVLVSELNAQ
jgi:TldD protein